MSPSCSYINDRACILSLMIAVASTRLKPCPESVTIPMQTHQNLSVGVESYSHCFSPSASGNDYCASPLRRCCLARYPGSTPADPCIKKLSLSFSVHLCETHQYGHCNVKYYKFEPENHFLRIEHTIEMESILYM